MSISRRIAGLSRGGLAGLGRLALLIFASLPLLLGQSQAAPAFEVTSVKLFPPEQRNFVSERTCSGARFASRASTVASLVTWAYHFETFPVLGPPSWTGARDNRYDIEGRASAPMTVDECRLMVQTLLADRFKLKVHWESQDTPVYGLVVAKGGSKIQKVTESDAANSIHFVLAGSPVQMFDPKLKGWTMDQLAWVLVTCPP